MRLYTWAADWREALTILERGFADRDDPWLGQEPRGVTLVDCTEAVARWPIVAVDLVAGEADLAAFELPEPSRPWREWLIPAAYLNLAAIASVVSEGGGAVPLLGGPSGKAG